MRISVLGSGSQGNATYLTSGSTHLLVDAGFSGREVVRRLAQIGATPESLSGIVVTHEHSDHTRGIGVLARRYGIPLFMTHATRAASAPVLTGAEAVHPYRPGHPFEVGELRIEPFLTVHDAAEPVAVTVSALLCGTRVGIATDLGRPTAGIRHSLAACDFLVLEANHDEQLLRLSPYPPSVQARIASSHGHLSNRAAADFALELLHPRLAGILLAHLSDSCNRPELARDAVARALNGAGWKGFLSVAGQEEPTPLLDIAELRARSGEVQLTLL